MLTTINENKVLHNNNNKQKATTTLKCLVRTLTPHSKQNAVSVYTQCHDGKEFQIIQNPQRISIAGKI